MTIEQAKIILSTYKMPLTKKKLEEYRMAIKILSGAFVRRQDG